MSRPVIVLLSLALAVAACGGTSAEITDGSYRTFAAADGAGPDLSLDVDGDALTFTGPGGTTEATLGESAGSYPVCGPDQDAPVLRVGTPVMVGDDEWADPGLFGDCGITSPVRVTLVDLDSLDDSLGVVPFARWVELCDLADPDC